MRRSLFAVISIMISLAAFVFDARAVQTTGAPLLDFPLNARVRAMGDNGAADNTEPGNIYFNPANVVGLYSRVYAQGTRWSIPNGFADDIWLGGLSAGFCQRKAGRMSLGADVSYGRLDYGDVANQNVFEESATLALGVGVPFGNGNEVRFGAAAKRWWTSLAPADVSQGDGGSIDLNAWAFDFGSTAAFNTTWKEWTLSPAIAVAVVNAGNDIEVPIDGATSDPLPTRLHFGGSVCIASPNVSVLSAQVPLVSIVGNVDGNDRMHDQPFTWGMGTELALAQILFLRNGFTNDPGDTDIGDSSAWGVGLGLPADRFRLRFDYSHTSHYYEPDIYGVALSWDL